MASLHRRAIALLGLVLAVAPAGADEIYRWTDESGKVHFGNRPPAGKVHDVDTTQGAAVNQGGGEPVTQQAAPVGKKDEDRAARLADCKRIGSAHCDDPAWIDAKRPKTIDEKNALHEQRSKAYKARMNKEARSRGEPQIY